MHTNQASRANPISDDGISLDELSPPADAASADAPPRVADWQPRGQLNKGRSRIAERPQTSPRSARRFDPPEFTFEDIQLATSPDRHPHPSELPSPMPVVSRREGGQVGTWLMISFGTLTFLGGLGAIGWSLAAERPEFWNLALGLTLAGQGALVFGLVLVAARLWRHGRYATGKLQTVHAQLVQLQRTADELAAMRGGAPTFYADLARGASPQMLLANLKGQLDQLTMRLGG